MPPGRWGSPTCPSSVPPRSPCPARWPASSGCSRTQRPSEAATTSATSTCAAPRRCAPTSHAEEASMPALDGDLLIIGAGLIGTSVGLAATAAGWSVRLLDADPDRPRLAASLGAGTAAPPAGDNDDAPGLELVAVPPAVIGSACIDALRTYPQAVVSHVGSVQSKPLAQVEASGVDLARFV